MRIKRRNFIGGAAALGALGDAETRVLLGRNSGGTGALPPSLTSFITSYSPSSTRNDLSVVGQAVLIGPSQITVYEVGGRVVADNSQTHQIVICTDGPVPRLLCPGGRRR